MKPKEKEAGASRRDFLKVAAAAAPAAAVAAVAAPQTAEAAAPTGEVRLQDTAHTRAYYDSARF
jgi:anaerobic selenocysteine-containing dehydrogenase